MRNQIMLITYADSLGADLKELDQVLEHFRGAVGGLHILPFYPSSADRGFAPLGYKQVDAALGSAEDIRVLADKYWLMADFMVNHISRQSDYFQDFQRRKDESPYRDFFIRYKDFWPGGEPTEEQLAAVYKRKPRPPYTEVEFADGSREKLWCTFGEEQIDLNLQSDSAKAFMEESIKGIAEMGAGLIRLDAMAYAIKKPGGSCFFEQPETWQLLEWIKGIAPGVDILPEVHEHYSLQHKLADKGYWIYDFALPALVLHAIYSADGSYLKRWLEMSPKRQFTTLDTHDGIGMVDVKDLLPDEEAEFLQRKIFDEGANVSRQYSTEAYGNLDIYQLNTTYYSALGDRDDAYLLARAIQFFAPGIPQVYYVGALAGSNDLELVQRTKNGRDINRHNYTLQQVEQQLERPVVQKLRELMRVRSSHPAFALDGDISVRLPQPSRLEIERRFRNYRALLKADLSNCSYSMECIDI